MTIARFTVLPMIVLYAIGTPRRAADPVTRARVEPRTVLATVNGVPTFDTGYGSGIAVDPWHQDIFFLLSDRGPNYDAGKDIKAFVQPDYVPRIGRFRLEHGVLTQIGKIGLGDESGARLTGLPSAGGPAGTGETAVAVDGTPLRADPSGVDPEGLVALKEGGFWISEEYGPSLIHLDAAGRTLERVSPSRGAHPLPLVLQKRRPNRGLEGVALLPDGKTLVTVLEGPLENPKEAGRKSMVTRLLSYDTRTGGTRQYLYLQDAVDDRNSDLAAISQTELLLLERDATMPGDSAHPSTIKRIYRINLAGATDVSDPANGAEGKLVNGTTLEASTPEELRTAGIVPVRKELVADLLRLGYPHDKPEGVTIIDASTIAVSNDDDFGVIEGPAPKLLRVLKETDFNEVFIIRLPVPLR